ncbi:MAG TPA: heme peroxidase family protein [Pyrinomonadaceae bacterium]|jgi:hypothetical protein|nr:heme peroxidase family protein [Pyrinomonadaceae bacterium]
MRGHIVRNAYYVRNEGVIVEPDYLTGGSGCPYASPPTGNGTVLSALGFGRMFPKSSIPADSRVFQDLHDALITLGQQLNMEPVPPARDSEIPAGYTYLGQFIAHEITYDKQEDLPLVEPDPRNSRSPSIDLDSLYGDGPDNEQFYEADRASLKIGRTLKLPGSGTDFPNDLYRDPANGKAHIPDPRNDENLAVAQLHVAFAKFHNNVVAALKEEGIPADLLFARAQGEVVKYFQWLVLHDFLPRIVDASVLDCVLKHGLRWFRVIDATDLYMPLEFSAAAFRLGHSMVRNEYRWNKLHTDNEPGSLQKKADLVDLFEQTNFSGGIQKGNPALRGDWVIDWRRFFKFEGKNAIDESRHNSAARIDTNFDFRSGDKLRPFTMASTHKPIPVRNLLRGLALMLPTGEEVADSMGEISLKHEQIIEGPEKDILNTSVFAGKTPLWFYILKEAELSGGNHLGRVGSRIVAETLVGLIKNSQYSILAEPDGMRAWQPDKYGTRFSDDGQPIFAMVDLLEFANAVNPYTGP